MKRSTAILLSLASFWALQPELAFGRTGRNIGRLKPFHRPKAIKPIGNFGVFIHAKNEASGSYRYTLSPIFTYQEEPSGRKSHHILPPFLYHTKTPNESRGNFLGFVHWSQNNIYGEPPERNFVLFPFIFYKHAPKQPEKSYFGLFPIAGSFQNIIWEKASWIFFPLSFKTESRGITRTHTPWPFIQRFRGEGVSGLYLWPIVGRSQKEGSFKQSFMFWPFIYKKIDRINTPAVRVRRGFFPFYMEEKSAQVQDKLIFLTGYRHDSKKNYHEHRWLWPIFIRGYGPDRYINKWLPFYSYTKIKGFEKTALLWPLVQKSKQSAGNLEIRRSQFLYFLYWNETQESTEPEKPFKAKLTHIWPFVSSYDNGQGFQQIQIPSLLPVFLPNNPEVRRTYGPILSPIRWERRGESRRFDFLWKFIQLKSSPETRRMKIWLLMDYRTQTGKKDLALLGGLINFSQNKAKKRWRLFKKVPK